MRTANDLTYTSATQNPKSTDWQVSSRSCTPGCVYSRDLRHFRHIANRESAFQLEMSRNSPIYRVGRLSLGIRVTLSVTSRRGQQFARNEKIYVPRDCFGIFGTIRRDRRKIECALRRLQNTAFVVFIFFFCGEEVKNNYGQIEFLLFFPAIFHYSSTHPIIKRATIKIQLSLVHRSDTHTF